MNKYVFRIYTGNMVYDGIVVEATIIAVNDKDAQEKAAILANGRPFSCNRQA